MWLAVRDATIAVATGSQRRQTRGKWGAEMRIGIVALLSVLSLSLARAYVLTCFFIGIDMLAALQMSRHI